MKKLLLVLTIVCLVFTSCKKTPVITLSVDKSEISADGIDMAKFKVICNDEDDVTKEARIFFADTNKELGAAKFSTTEPKTYSFYASYEDVTSEKVSVKAVKINDDNNGNGDNGNGDNDDNGNGNNDDNGNDDNGNDDNGNDDNGNDDNGNGNDDGNDDNGEVDEVVLALSVNKTSILADGEDAAVFTVTADGSVLPDGYQVLNVADSSLVADGVFVTAEAGLYTFVALYNKVASNEVVVEALVVEQPDPVVELKVDKTSIKNDGVDKVTFTVLVDGEDLTSASVITNQTTGVTLYGNVFSSLETGEFSFNADYNGFQSESVIITVKEISAYAPGDYYEVDGVRGVVFYVEEGGKSGLIMSLDQAYLQWSTENVWVNCLSQKGEWNTEDMLAKGADKYPAAKWCVDHGEGWYMPSSYEMHLMWDAVSDGKHVFDDEFVKLYNDKLEDPILEDYYWSSSEIAEDTAEVVVFIDNSVVCLDPAKNKQFHVRAIHKF